MDPLRCILLGTGNIGNTYAAACAKCPDVELVGVVSRDAERAQAWANEKGIPHGSDSLDALADQAEAVLAATPNGHHGDNAADAAGKGLHVLVEKPLDITEAAMDRAIKACREANVKLGVCYQRRLRTINRTVKELLDSGALGKVLAVDVSTKFWRDQGYYDSGAWRGTWAEDGGGPFIQQAIHDLDLFCWFFGLPARLSAHCATLNHSGIEVEDHGAASGVMPNGAIVSFVASTICRPGFEARMDVVTDQGTCSLSDDAVHSWNIDGVESPGEAPEPAEGRKESAHTAVVSDSSGHESVLSDFAKAVREDREPTVNGEQGRLATDLCLAIYRSAREGAAVRLDSTASATS